MSLSGKTVVITGASRGIGKAMALAYAREKANLALVARNEEALKSLSQEIQSIDNKIHYYAIDIKDGTAVAQTVEKIQQDFGSLDILINNAGITKDNLILRMKEEDWDEVLSVNLKSVFHWSKAVSRIMLKQKSGVILNMSSVVGITGNAGQSNYAASKAGILGFTKSLARELGSRGIRVLAVAPGFIETDMTQAIPEDLKEMTKKNISLGRWGKAEEVAELCVFLSSPKASYITGTTIQVDGGISL